MGTISYIIREGSWGNGYATQAANHVVSAAFTTTGLTRLEAMHHPDSPASGRVLAKAGFTPRWHVRSAHRRRNRRLRGLRAGDHGLNRLSGPHGDGHSARRPVKRRARCRTRSVPLAEVPGTGGQCGPQWHQQARDRQVGQGLGQGDQQEP
ncbi:GNAT family N-acetyltransferase [Streptomyces sp. NPDC014861]|uniref:GNAT family N-acetyltransferase n=1 Tax=Streptomyces sp. NPDC014861 TaxID=3364923 RepID=UPI0036FB702E